MVSLLQQFLWTSVNSDSAKELRLQCFPTLFDNEMLYSTEHLLTHGTSVV